MLWLFVQLVEPIEQTSALLVAWLVGGRLCCTLLCLLLRRSDAVSYLEVVDQYGAVERACCSRPRRCALGAELHGVVVLLAPLDKAALEVGLGLIDLLQREI